MVKGSPYYSLNVSENKAVYIKTPHLYSLGTRFPMSNLDFMSSSGYVVRGDWSPWPAACKINGYSDPVKVVIIETYGTNGWGKPVVIESVYNWRANGNYGPSELMTYAVISMLPNYHTVANCSYSKEVTNPEYTRELQYPDEDNPYFRSSGRKSRKKQRPPSPYHIPEWPELFDDIERPGGTGSYMDSEDGTDVVEPPIPGGHGNDPVKDIILDGTGSGAFGDPPIIQWTETGNVQVLAGKHKGKEVINDFLEFVSEAMDFPWSSDAIEVMDVYSKHVVLDYETSFTAEKQYTSSSTGDTYWKVTVTSTGWRIGDTYEDKYSDDRYHGY